MKKVIIACLLLVSLASCSNNSKPNADTAVPMKEITTEATTTTEVATEIPPATEPETEINEVLEDNEFFTLTYHGYDSLATIQRINLDADNHSDKYLVLFMEDFCINDIEMEPEQLFLLEGYKSTKGAGLKLLNSKLQEKEITRTNKLQFKIHAELRETMSGNAIENYDSDIITITR